MAYRYIFGERELGGWNLGGGENVRKSWRPLIYRVEMDPWDLAYLTPSKLGR